MSTAVILEWVQALESGKYQQGKNRLTNITADGTETDCCLGVLCKLAVIHGIIDPPGRVPLSAGAITHAPLGPDAQMLIYDNQVTDLLPLRVAEWAFEGVDAVSRDNYANPVVAYETDEADGHVREFTATEANDGADWDFAQIAAGLRATYLGEETAA